MRRMQRHILLSIIMFCCIFYVGLKPVHAQELITCTEKLNLAEDEFEEGHLYEVNNLLDQCLEQGFSRDEKVRAYRLLTITSLYLDRYALADQYYLQLLKINPEFTPNPLVDPSELLYLHDKFLTSPTISLTLLKAGINLTYLNTLTNFTMDGSIGLQNPENPIYNSETPREEVLFVPGIEVGTGIDYRLMRNTTASLELLVAFNRFKRIERSLGISTLNLQESQLFLKVPLSVKYTFEDLGLKPYLYSGVSLDLLLNTVIGKLERRVTIFNISSDTTTNGQEMNSVFDPISDPNINLNKKRNLINGSLVIGGGLKYKLGINYVAFDVRYNMGLNNLAKRATRYEPDDPLLYKYWYVDDDFRQNNLSFNISFIKPIYRPRKVTK